MYYFIPFIFICFSNSVVLGGDPAYPDTDFRKSSLYGVTLVFIMITHSSIGLLYLYDQ